MHLRTLPYDVADRLPTAKASTAIWINNCISPSFVSASVQNLLLHRQFNSHVVRSIKHLGNRFGIPQSGQKLQHFDILPPIHHSRIRNESKEDFERRNDNKRRQEPHSIHWQDDGNPRMLFHDQSSTVAGAGRNTLRPAAANRPPHAVSHEGDRLHRAGCAFKQLRAGHKVVRIGQYRLGQYGHLARGKTLYGPAVRGLGRVISPGCVQRL